MKNAEPGKAEQTNRKQRGQRRRRKIFNKLQGQEIYVQRADGTYSTNYSRQGMT